MTQRVKGWVVKLSNGKERFLTPSQMGKLKEGVEAGAKLVDFGAFAVNLSFVEEWWAVTEIPDIPIQQEVEISPKQTAENLRRLREIVDRF